MIIADILRGRKNEGEGYREFTEADFLADEDHPGKTYLPWAKEHYGEWLKDFQKDAPAKAMTKHPGTEEGRLFDALSEYCGFKSKMLKDDEIEIISKEFTKPVSEIDENIIVYRLDNRDPDEISEGKIIKWNGFLSTGLIKERLLNNKEFNMGNILLRILVPKGVHGLYLEFISHRHEEQEMLFPWNSRMEIIKVTGNGKLIEVTVKLLV